MWTCGTVWSGFDLGVLLHTHVHLGVLAWAQCDKRGCDVVSSLLFHVPASPHYWYLEKTNADSNRSPIDKKNNGIQKKKFENFQFSLVEVEVLKAFVEHLASVVCEFNLGQDIPGLNRCLGFPTTCLASPPGQATVAM